MTNFMKIIATLLVLSSTLLALEWVKDLTTALSIAQKEHKNIMVMVESKHCRWCKKMKEDTLSNKSIEKKLEQFVSVRVMQNNAKEISMLPPVNGVPTIFFMRENKEIIENVIGYFNVEKFTTYLNNVEKKIK